MYKSNNFKDAIIPIEVLNSYKITDENKLFLLLVVFHRNKLISDHSLKDLFANLREGKLNRRVGTFKCKLNNVWYNDESILNIYIDVLSNVRDTTVPMSDFLQYVNRYLNKPRNYCIDYIIGNYVLPFFDDCDTKHQYWHGGTSYMREQAQRMLQMFNISETLNNPNTYDYDRFEPTGYCCEDCDGDYDEYKQSQYECYVWCNVREDIRKELNDYFNGIRDESYLKNPIPANLFRMP